MYAVIKAEWRKNSSHRPAFPKPWVAQIQGLSERWGFDRKFMDHYCDYTYATRSGSRGIYFYFPLPPGLYERFEQVSWKHDLREFFRVDANGQIERISKEEVINCLKK